MSNYNLYYSILTLSILCLFTIISTQEESGFIPYTNPDVPKEGDKVFEREFVYDPPPTPETPDLKESALHELTDLNLEHALISYRTLLMVFITKKEDLDGNEDFKKTLLEAANILKSSDPKIYVAYAVLTTEILKSRVGPVKLADPKNVKPINILLYDLSDFEQPSLDVNISELTSNQLVDFCKSKVIQIIYDIQEYYNVIAESEYDMFVIFFLGGEENIAYFDSFKKVALSNYFKDKPIKFLYGNTHQTGQDLQMESGNVLIKKKWDDKESTILGGFTESQLREKIEINCFEMYSKLKTLEGFWDKEKPLIILFRDNDLDKGKRERLDHEIRKAKFDLIKKYGSLESVDEKITFLIMGWLSEEEYAIADYSRVSETEIKIGIIDTRDPTATTAKTYLMEGEITAINILNFIDNFFNDKLTYILKSEEIPEDNMFLPIKKVVGKNFHDLVLNSDNDFFLMIGIDMCSPCINFKETFSHLHSEINGLNDGLMFGILNDSKNEIKEITPRTYPELHFFKKGEKQNPIFYDGDKSFEDLLKFLQKHSTFPLKIKSVVEDSRDVLDKISKLGGEDKEEKLNEGKKKKKRRARRNEDSNEINLDTDLDSQEKQDF